MFPVNLSTERGRAELRALLTLGGQALGQSIAFLISGVTALTYTTPEGIIIGTLIGAFLQSLDKYLREKEVYKI